MNIFVYGAGKLGSSLARSLREAGAKVTLRAARRGLPEKPMKGDVIILAVRDKSLGPLAKEIIDRGLASPTSVYVHVAGALGPEVLAPLSAYSAGVAQMHPMIAFARSGHSPTLAGGHGRVSGDPEAVWRARKLLVLLGMRPRELRGLDTVGYHAAAGLVANGAAALAALGSELLIRSGVPAELTPKLLGPLLRSVADNVEHLGFPGSLTGPVRRGELSGLEKHLATIRQRLPEAADFYLASAKAQLPLAAKIADAPPQAFEAIATWLDRELKGDGKAS